MSPLARDDEAARIMALAPVIPVLTVRSIEDGLKQAKALIAGGLRAIEVTLRTPSALAAITAIAKDVPTRSLGLKRSSRLDRSRRRPPQERVSWSVPARRPNSTEPGRERRSRFSRAARRLPKRWP